MRLIIRAIFMCIEIASYRLLTINIVVQLKKKAKVEGAMSIPRNSSAGGSKLNVESSVYLITF